MKSPFGWQMTDEIGRRKMAGNNQMQLRPGAGMAVVMERMREMHRRTNATEAGFGC
jgi:hypothetical protein